MKKMKTFIAFLLILSTSVSFGQSYVFKVLANKGSNEIKVGNKWERLRTGATLLEKDVIRVSKNAYIGLVHHAGHAVEWKEEGEFKVSVIAERIPKFSSVTTKYAEFLASKSSEPGKGITAGGVHRGLKGQIQIFAPEDVSVYNTEATIRWEPLDGTNINYRIKVTDMYDEIVVEEKTSEPFYKLDLSHPKLVGSLVILVRVSSYGEVTAQSEQIAIKQLSQSKKQEIVNDLIPLMRELNNETAIAKYILAGFFEENQLLLDAVHNYEAAIKMAPDVMTYKEAYENFLIRNALKIISEK